MDHLLRSRAMGRLLCITALLAACTDATLGPRPAICSGTPAFDLWVVDRTGAEARLLDSSGADGFADWSPDGRRLAFVSSRDGNCDVLVVDADGSDLVDITAGAADELYPSWSPDGSRIVFSRYDGAGAQLWVVHVETGDEERVTESAILHNYPDWSPDGTSIIFVGGTEPAGPGAVHEIYTVSVDDGVETQLTESGRLLVGPKWSPNGRRIAYFDHTGPPRIWMMDADGSGRREVTDGGHVAWSPDGESLVFDREVATGDVDLFVDGEVLVDGPGVDTLPAWSPDGDMIAFSSDRP